MEVGRRGVWGCELKRLLGSDIFNHVIYYDTVGCAHSRFRLQRVVVTDTHLYMFNDNTRNRPEPLCELHEIEDLDADHETPSAYHSHPDFDAHHIFFSVRGKQYHLYTFEPGTDLYWRLRNACDNANRCYEQSLQKKKALQPGHIRVVTDGGKEVPEHSYYTRLFNQISSRVVHAKTHKARMKALGELEEVSQKYFSTRTIFFQSSTLLSYLMDTLTYLSDFHTVPTQVRINRFEQVELISCIYKTFSFYLEGSTTVHDAMKLITYNNGCFYKTLVKALFQTEWFILSQPKRAEFFLKEVNQKDKYLSYLQEIENIGVTVCYQLYSLSILGWRTLRIENCDKNMFLNILKENEAMVMNGGFHTVVFMLIQMCYMMPTISVTSVFCHSLYDHLWLIDFIMTNFPAAAELVRREFISEFDVVVVESRIEKCIPREFRLFEDIMRLLRSAKATIHKRPIRTPDRTTQPVLFK